MHVEAHFRLVGAAVFWEEGLGIGVEGGFSSKGVWVAFYF